MVDTHMYTYTYLELGLQIPDVHSGHLWVHRDGQGKEEPDEEARQSYG